MKRKIFSILLALVLVVSFSLVTAVPVGAQGTILSVDSDGDTDFSLDDMDQRFSTETIDASGGVTLSGSVTLGNFNLGNVDDVWYEIGLVSNATYLGYSRLHNKGVYMIALWDGTNYKVHIQNVPGTTPNAQQTGNYLGDEAGYVALWDDAELAYFKVPSNSFDFEIAYTATDDSSGTVDLRITVGGGTSGWKLYQYAEDDLEIKLGWSHEDAAAAGYATDDDLTNARIVSQIFEYSTATATFTATYDNIQIDGTPYELAPRVLNVDTGKGYTAIQLAIDAPETAATHTISVAAGMYNERVNVDNSLTLEGANAGVPATETRGPESIINPQGLELDFGVLIDGVDTIATFDGFTVENYERAGILAGAFSLENDPAVVHILNNIVTEPIGQHNNNCIQVGDGTTGTVIGNEVSGANLESPDWSGSGILVSGSSNVLVSNNYVHDCEGGIQIQGYAEYRDAPAENNIVEKNLVEGNESGIVPQINSIGTIIRYNDVLNNEEGIAVMGMDSDSWGGGEHSVPSGTEVHFNNIVGNIEGVVSAVWYSDTGLLAEEVDATKNWWGDATGADHADNPHGTGQGGDAVSDNVDFTPWYATSTTTPTSQDVSVDHPTPAGTIIAYSDTIQGGIDASLSGDTVIVATGNYSATIDNSILLEDGENLGYCFVHIDKPITLVGESRDEVILDGAGLQGEVRSTGIWVSVSNVRVKNLTIQNFEGPPNYSYGLYVMEKFRDYEWENVAPLQYVTAENLKVADCQASLYFMKTEYATVKDCIVENNSADGIWVAWSSHHATVQGNIVTNSGDHGIWVGSTWMGQGYISNDATIKGNTVDGAREAGIWFAGEGCIIEDNEVTNIQGDPAGWSNGAVTLGVNEVTSNVVMRYNKIHDNSTYGIGISAASDVTNTHINYNSIYNNIGYGLKNETGVLVDAKYNWWGEIGGPGGEGSGLGDSVSSNVTYDPWLTEKQAKTVSDGIAYFGSTIPLEPGWNTLSVPLKLKDSANTMSEIMDLGDFITNENVQIVYQYKAGSGWENIGASATELVPLRGYYIKILGTDTVDFPVLYSGTLGLSTLNLSNGWNLIGSGFGINKTDYGIAATTGDVDGQKEVATALYSIKDKCSVVVSPSTQGQKAAWGTTVIDSDKFMIVGEAYWVFMTTPTPTLAGFEVTPIYYLP